HEQLSRLKACAPARRSDFQIHQISRGKDMRFIFRLVPILAIAGTPALAQSDSRVAEIAAQQEQKATQVTVDRQNRVERAMLWFQSENSLQRFLAGAGGFRPKIGGMGPGTGFGIGPAYGTDLLGGYLRLNASAQASFRGDRRFDIDLAAPKLGGGRYFAG